MKKYVSFVLSMPNRGSWNGGWSGEKNLYCKIKSFNDTKKNQDRLSKLPGSYYYNFGDGWGASINVEIVDGKTSSKLKRQSRGFCGYDWMIDSIISNGEIKCK